MKTIEELKVEQGKEPAMVKVPRTGRVATKMIVFEDGIDARSRSVKVPTVAMFRVKDTLYKYIVIGTAYGHIHTTGGDVRTWKSYSGARRAALKYVGL